MTWANAVLQGIFLGGAFALTACGLSLMFGVMRLVNLAHGDLAVVGAYLTSTVMLAMGLPWWVATLLVLPVAFGIGAALQLGVLDRAAQAGPLAPLLLTFGLSVVIQNLLLQGYSANVRSIDAGMLGTSGLAVGGLALPWIGVAKLLAALGGLGGLSLLLRRTAWGRAVRAIADDLPVARLMGIRVRPLFASVTGIAVAAAALAGVLSAVASTFDPRQGSITLIFAFEAVIIGGLGSLWGTLLGGVALGVVQAVVAQVDVQYAVLASHVFFLLVLVLRPRGMVPGAQASA